MIFKIKHRWSGAILFSIETETFKLAIEAAIKSKANLSKADLSGADLSKADLSGANLSKADLSGANLSWANLSWANLSWADLSGANLSGASLSGAYLSGADLSGAYLSWADLSGANLSGANLSGANLSVARTTIIRDDFWAVLSSAPAEVESLIAALKDGKVDGSTYQGECACLVGTIANARRVNFQSLGILQPDSSRPIERFFMAIKKGDTPETNPVSKLTLEWAELWLANMRATFSSSAQ